MAVLVDCIVTVSEVCLSPQMDILALLTLDGTLMVNRTTSWQCLLAPTDAVAAGAISALCWSPDGRQLALGHRRGGLSILDVEAGALVSRTCYSDHMVHNSCISLMFWARQVTAKGTGVPVGVCVTYCTYQLTCGIPIGGLSRPRRTAPNCSKAPILQRPRLRVRWPNSTHSTCCLLYTSPSPRDQRGSRMPSSA